MPLFDSDFLARLEYLSLVSKRVFQGQLIAQRRTFRMGAGIEFADHRPYTPGDDFRYLNWNIYARHDQLLLKRFHEEQDLHVYVLVDCSASMAMGNPRKFDHARRIAAALAYIALADLDRVALLAMAGDVVAEMPMTRGKGRILAMLDFLQRLEPAGRQTDLSQALGALVHRRMRTGPAIIISDLFDPKGYERGLNRLRYHRFEPHVIHVFDPSEAKPKVLGDVELTDVESDEIRRVTVTEASLRQYQALFTEFMEGVERYCRTYGLGWTQASTAVPFDDLILQMMRVAGVVR